MGEDLFGENLTFANLFRTPAATPPLILTLYRKSGFLQDPAGYTVDANIQDVKNVF